MLRISGPLVSNLKVGLCNELCHACTCYATHFSTGVVSMMNGTLEHVFYAMEVGIETFMNFRITYNNIVTCAFVPTYLYTNVVT